ncbi:alpha-amylase family glycosyl hydrolase [Asticcacaulis sp. DXS10W]|uniref:Alpha-amylase family glycosyl hydrolase n=1 Tax=Asticcacaulis currens TaxID=2984210 RepID=A0ABT5IC87_9CAUL|nr:alpha-amylase family glycosyl hydrolase [Asticcacaulis currens]MDC7693799.1 alpha-amylase family glycosyl hydrolase [Asticcacaulis currens]
MAIKPLIGVALACALMATGAHAQTARAEFVQTESKSRSSGSFCRAFNFENRCTLFGMRSKIDVSKVIAEPRDNGLPAHWNRSATFMEIFVRSYQDSDGDGIGDFNGLTSRLDYLKSLGVTGIWLMPMHPSADKDHGYAVSDYRAVNPAYGTMADFERFVAEAHKRGIGVIIDYVMNHSASDNPIFISAAKSKTSPYRDWYIFADKNPNWAGFSWGPWRQNKVGKGYFYGLFDDQMPDFNLKNQRVIDYHADNFRFWLNKGVDGFRIDAVTMLVENGPTAYMDQPENLEVLKQVNAVVKAYPNRYLICEASEQPALYAGEACTNSFAFGTQKEIKSSAREGKLSSKLATQLASDKRSLMPLVLQSHDSYVGDRLIHDLDAGSYRVAAAVSVLASDTPFSYYGEEIGLANNGKYDDPGLRAPMSWDGSAGHGFTKAARPYRAYATNAATHNVKAQSGEGGSLLEYYRALYLARQAHPVLADGTLTLLSKAGEEALVFARQREGQKALVFINLSATAQTFQTKGDGVWTSALDLGAPAQLTAEEGNLRLILPPKGVAAYVAKGEK